MDETEHLQISISDENKYDALIKYLSQNSSENEMFEISINSGKFITYITTTADESSE